MWPLGQAVKTLASHAGIRGSIPLGVTIIKHTICWFKDSLNDFPLNFPDGVLLRWNFYHNNKSHETEYAVSWLFPCDF